MKIGDLVKVSWKGKPCVGILVKLPTKKYMASGCIGQVLVDGVLHYVNKNSIEILETGELNES